MFSDVFPIIFYLATAYPPAVSSLSSTAYAINVNTFGTKIPRSFFFSLLMDINKKKKTNY